MTRRLRWTIALVVLTLASPAFAGFVVVTSPGALGGDDRLDWSTLGSTGTVLATQPAASSSYSPFDAITARGIDVNVVAFANGTGTDVTVSGDQITFGATTNGQLGSPVAPGITLTLNFATPIVGFGADLSYTATAVEGWFVDARLYDAAGQFLVTESLHAASSGSDSQSFSGYRGVYDDTGTASISKVELQIYHGHAVASPVTLTGTFGSFDLATGAAAVPEPSTLTMGLAGSLLLAGAIRRRRSFESGAVAGRPLP